MNQCIFPFMRWWTSSMCSIIGLDIFKITWWNSYMSMLCLTNPCMFEIDNVCTICTCRPRLIHKLCWNIPVCDGITTGHLLTHLFTDRRTDSTSFHLDRGSECINICIDLLPLGFRKLDHMTNAVYFSCKKRSFLQLPNNRKDKRSHLVSFMLLRNLNRSMQY